MHLAGSFHDKLGQYCHSDYDTVQTFKILVPRSYLGNNAVTRK
jgi:hypothetical protein